VQEMWREENRQEDREEDKEIALVCIPEGGASPPSAELAAHGQIRIQKPETRIQNSEGTADDADYADAKESGQHCPTGAAKANP
jgi:hypothetical protein